jgi:hypothetical protein
MKLHNIKTISFHLAPHFEECSQVGKGVMFSFLGLVSEDGLLGG